MDVYHIKDMHSYIHILTLITIFISRGKLGEALSSSYIKEKILSERLSTKILIKYSRIGEMWDAEHGRQRPANVENDVAFVTDCNVSWKFGAF